MSPLKIIKAIVALVFFSFVLGLNGCGSEGTTAPAPSFALHAVGSPKGVLLVRDALFGLAHFDVSCSRDGASSMVALADGRNCAGVNVEVELPVHLVKWDEGQVGVEAYNEARSARYVYGPQVLPHSLGMSLIGYFKASNTDAGDQFGYSVSLSGDGQTLAVGARQERSNGQGINGDESDNTADFSGAVYVFARNLDGTWRQEAYIKASNSEFGDYFGYSVSLSRNGNTLVVGSFQESSAATGVNGDESDNGAVGAGAAFVYSRSGSTWQQEAYVKASNTAAVDGFGFSVCVSGDGNTFAVGAMGEDSGATGINGDGSDNSEAEAGAVYVFSRSGNTWQQQAYVKSSNAAIFDNFGWALSLSFDGKLLAVGAIGEDSSATGIGGDDSDNSAAAAGAVYVFAFSGGSWRQEAYVKASNTNAGDFFGHSVAVSGDGHTLAVGAYREGSGVAGINGDESDNTAADAGAVYVFNRSRSSGTWQQEAYVKASAPGGGDRFGQAVALSFDGNTLAVGAHYEDSNATGLGGDETDDSVNSAGAAYVFTRSEEKWQQINYVKASNTGEDDFGNSLSLSGDGNTLAVGAMDEAGGGTGIGADQSDNSAANSGAVYLY